LGEPGWAVPCHHHEEREEVFEGSERGGSAGQVMAREVVAGEPKERGLEKFRKGSRSEVKRGTAFCKKFDNGGVGQGVWLPNDSTQEMGGRWEGGTRKEEWPSKGCLLFSGQKGGQKNLQVRRCTTGTPKMRNPDRRNEKKVKSKPGKIGLSQETSKMGWQGKGSFG